MVRYQYLRRLTRELFIDIDIDIDIDIENALLEFVNKSENVENLRASVTLLRSRNAEPSDPGYHCRDTITGNLRGASLPSSRGEVKRYLFFLRQRRLMCLI